MVSYSDGLSRWLLFSLLSVLVICLIFGSPVHAAPLNYCDIVGQTNSLASCTVESYCPVSPGSYTFQCPNGSFDCGMWGTGYTPFWYPDTVNLTDDNFGAFWPENCNPQDYDFPDCNVVFANASMSLCNETPTPTPTPTPIPATWDCSDTYTSVICHGGSIATNLNTSVVYTSNNQVDANCWDFGKLPEGDYSTSGGIVTVGTCQFPVIPEQNSTCVNIDGYHFMSGSKFGLMAVMVIGSTGSHAAAAPFLWMATLEAPCPEGSSPVNTTPTPTPELTWVPGPYVPPTYVPPTPPGGEGGVGSVGFPKPTGTLVGPGSVLYPTGLTTIPTNISMPLLPVTLPDLPDQLNTTTYISFINSTPLIGPLIAYPLTYINSLMVSINNQILFLLSFIVSPLKSLTSSFVSITANIDAVLNSWQTGASLITALMWYSFQAIPTKVLNVLSLALFFDILELIFDWPEELQ